MPVAVAVPNIPSPTLAPTAKPNADISALPNVSSTASFLHDLKTKVGSQILSHLFSLSVPHLLTISPSVHVSPHLSANASRFHNYLSSSAPYLQGYCVVPSVIPKEKCDAYVSDAFSWLEGFGRGFKRGDRSTWTDDHLPVSGKGGLYNKYGVGHEDWVWRARW